MKPSNAPNLIPAIVGPTASGKTALGVELALALGNGEVINCDSVQIYKEIEIATAKPTAEEMKGVPHHLIGYVPPEIDYTAADWARDAGEKIREIEARGNTAIIVGGTGFYLRTLRRPLFEGPPTDPSIRKKYRALLREKGAAHLHELLKGIDPESSERIPENDHIRTMRALEVYEQTGKRISDLQPDRADPPKFADRIAVFALAPPREELYRKINARAAAHFEAGLVNEVEQLLAKGVPPESNALGSHGYRRVREYLAGERSLESAIEKTAQDVRNYAKRQMTWFRKEEGVIWIEGFGNDPGALEKVLESVSAGDR